MKKRRGLLICLLVGWVLITLGVIAFRCLAAGQAENLSDAELRKRVVSLANEVAELRQRVQKLEDSHRLRIIPLEVEKTNPYSH